MGMLALAGKTDVSEGDLKKFMKSAGASDINDDSVKAVCSALKGKQLHEVINEGFCKISSLNVGGGGGGVATGGGNAGTTAVQEEAKKEEAPAEEEEEEEEDMDLDC